jgi:hypothetical protein
MIFHRGTLQTTPLTKWIKVGGLLKGDSVDAMGRDAKGDWLYVCLAASPCNYGWISLRTTCVGAAGDAMSLPVQAVDPPKPAHVRNCTYHPMLLKPGDVTIPPQTDSPKNDEQVDPGSYQVFDKANNDNPSKPVRSITLAEGESIDIVKDYIGNTYSCP